MAKIVSYRFDEIDDHAIKVDPENWQYHDLILPAEVTVESGGKYKNFELLIIALKSSDYATLPIGIGGDLTQP